MGCWGATQGADQGHGAVVGWERAWEGVNLTDVQEETLGQLFPQARRAAKAVLTYRREDWSP